MKNPMKYRKLATKTFGKIVRQKMSPDEHHTLEVIRQNNQRFKPEPHLDWDFLGKKL